MPYFFYLIDNSIPICRLLLYSLSVLILVTMSLLDERPSFKEPLPPIGSVQLGFAALFLFESGNNVQANLPNININKGRWTEEEHKIFMQEYEKYGNNCMQIGKVLSTRTPAQIKKHAECFFKQNLKTNSAAVKRYQESLSPDKKAQVLLKNVTEQQHSRQSLSPEKKTQIVCNNADAHKKQRESLPPEKKVNILKTDANAHKEK
jgi:hypothetical protein